MASSSLETALAEGRRYEEQVAQDLSGMVFKTVFPSLIEALDRCLRQRTNRRPVKRR